MQGKKWQENISQIQISERKAEFISEEIFK